MPELVIVGRVRRAHGVRGALAVESLIDSPDAVFASGAVIYAGDRNGAPTAEGALHIVDGRPMNNDWLVQVAEIDDRDVAAYWRGRYLLADASLVLTMERLHVRELVVLSPDLFGRTFTLPEFVTLASETGPRSLDEPLRTWVERVGADRNPMDQLASDPNAEVADPMGGSRRAFRACATELDDLLAGLVDLAWPPSQTHPDLAVTTIGESHADRHRR